MATGRKHGSPPSEFDGLKLAKPAQRALAGAGITRLVQLAKATDAELLALHGMGPNALQSIRAALAGSPPVAVPPRQRARPEVAQPRAAKTDPRVTAYIASRAPFARPLLTRLRRSIRAAAAGLEETIRWGMPTYLHNGKIVCGIAGFKAHCALWFRNGEEIVGRKPKDAMGNFGRLTTVDELPSAVALKALIEKSMKRIDG